MSDEWVYKKLHNIPLGSLVELFNGVRLYVVKHEHDDAGNPVYGLDIIGRVSDIKQFELTTELVFTEGSLVQLIAETDLNYFNICEDVNFKDPDKLTISKIFIGNEDHQDKFLCR